MHMRLYSNMRDSLAFAIGIIYTIVWRWSECIAVDQGHGRLICQLGLICLRWQFNWIVIFNWKACHIWLKYACLLMGEWMMGGGAVSIFDAKWMSKVVAGNGVGNRENSAYQFINQRRFIEPIPFPCPFRINKLIHVDNHTAPPHIVPVPQSHNRRRAAANQHCRIATKGECRKSRSKEREWERARAKS